jgi:hypothetical protein
MVGGADIGPTDADLSGAAIHYTDRLVYIPQNVTGFIGKRRKKFLIHCQLAGCGAEKWTADPKTRYCCPEHQVAGWQAEHRVGKNRKNTMTRAIVN